MHLQIGTFCAECSVLKPKKVFNRYEIVANSSGRPLYKNDFLDFTRRQF